MADALPSTNSSTNSVEEVRPDNAPELSRAVAAWTWSSVIFAILQSVCTAVIVISGVRVAIGLSALAAAAGIHAPAHGFHRDAIRIPMMAIALAGSLVNLYVIWKIRRLRANPAARWRQQAVPKSKRRAENLQIALSVITLLLLAAEWITHPMVHVVP
ncbi:MAG TPA: hypothetical protein VMT51_15695 [Dongiaceae bacterium]|nr:hypothetical protein [Dongiaceae bacterium]